VIHDVALSEAEFVEIAERFRTGNMTALRATAANQSLTFNRGDAATFLLPAAERKRRLRSLESATREAQGTEAPLPVPVSHVNPSPVKISCEVVSFDKEVREGRFRAVASEHLGAGEYPFTIIGGQDIRTYVTAMLHRATLTCLIEFQRARNKKKRAIRLQALSIEAARELGA
jgi:hypothetical protein